MKLLNWFAGFFEDHSGSGTGSSKRLVLYVFVYYVKVIIDGNLAGGRVDDTIVFAVAGVILFLIGAITSEFFKDSSAFIFKKKTTVETNTEATNQ